MLARLFIYLYVVLLGVAFLLQRPMELAIAVGP
jgi:hypothetical protein